MKRQIKFRAWHPEDKVMVYDLNSLRLFHGVLCQDDYEVMQFTGVQDKHGKDIFEGDILKIDNDGEIYTTYVRYEQGTLAIDVIGQEYNYTSLGWIDDWCELKVIGNIHENPGMIYY